MITITKEKLDVTKHILVPKHSKVSEKETKQLFEEYHITLDELPLISAKDPAIADLDVKPDDIIKIERESPTSNVTFFYRRVFK